MYIVLAPGLQMKSRRHRYLGHIKINSAQVSGETKHCLHAPRLPATILFIYCKVSFVFDIIVSTCFSNFHFGHLSAPVKPIFKLSLLDALQDR